MPIPSTSTIVTAERKFWRCVESGEPPTLFGVDPPKPRIEAVRSVDMSTSNAWGEFAGIFIRTREAHLEHETARAVATDASIADETRDDELTSRSRYWPGSRRTDRHRRPELQNESPLILTHSQSVRTAISQRRHKSIPIGTFTRSSRDFTSITLPRAFLRRKVIRGHPACRYVKCGTVRITTSAGSSRSIGVR
jgi:hypothetical protein